MVETRKLRARFLTALAGSGLIASVATACGGNTDSDGGSGGTAGAGGSGATGASGGFVSNGGSAGSAGSAGSGGTEVGGAGGSVASCDYGTPAEQCFTLDELEAQLNDPPLGGDIFGDAGAPDAWIEVTECLPREKVQDGCCNSASYGPKQDGELCCYVFCTGGCCGRAFVVGGAARVASAAARSDWRSPSSAAQELDPNTRRALADAWLQDALMEHASIASFSRFTLELLGFAAPPALVEAAQRAALDEIEHAKMCFTLASRFAGESVGPGPLELGGSALSATLAESAAAALEEGCIGETIAALTAREQCAASEDAEVRRVLARIAEDEERHAELAWRFVAWAIKTGGREVRVAVEAALERSLAPRAESVAERPNGVAREAWRRHGRLSESELAAVRLAALHDVIVPCARAVLGEPALALQAAL